MITVFIFWLFLISTLLQCCYLFYFFSRILFFNDTKSDKIRIKEQPVSIIICAKNETQNLKNNIPTVLSQKYHNKDGECLFEVIVVDDASTDNTQEIITALQLLFANLRLIRIPPDANRNLKGKKFALSKGVEASKHDFLLFTDADCMPNSLQWLNSMILPLLQGKELVAGYSGYYKHKGWLNAFIRWETVHTLLQYSTYLLAGKPYMAVGRNLACTKSAFLKAQSSKIWNELPSGDDDLLVNIIANKHNTALVLSNEAFTYTEAKADFNAWVHQKQRHLSTGKYYNLDTKLLLGMYALSHAIMWISFFLMLFFGNYQIALAVFSIRIVFLLIVFSATTKKINETRLIYFLPIFDLVWMVYNFVFSPFIFLKNKQNWK